MIRNILPGPVALVLLLACGTSDAQKVTIIENGKLEELLKNDEVQLVDVRTPEEVSFGRIEGAVHIDFYAPDFVSRISGLDKEKPLVVYCAAGGRSAQTAQKLKTLGFKEIYDLSGGFRSWSREGYPVVKGAR